MKARIAVLPGDGIGPEVTAAAVSVLRHVAAHYGHEFEFSEHAIGGCAIDAEGAPLSDATVARAKACGLVLLGAVGGPKWDKLLPAHEQEATMDKAIWHKLGDGEARTDEAILKKLIEDHHRWTGSQRARDILDHWAESRAKFVKVFPTEYRRALGELGAAKEAAATIAHAKAPAAKAKV